MTSTAPTLDIRRPSKWVAEVWLNRPDVRNAFNDVVIAELTEAQSCAPLCWAPMAKPFVQAPI